MRLDLVQASVQTIYVTIWASPNVSLHLGKIDNADETWRKHIGIRLQVSISALLISPCSFFFPVMFLFLDNLGGKKPDGSVIQLMDGK